MTHAASSSVLRLDKLTQHDPNELDRRVAMEKSLMKHLAEKVPARTKAEISSFYSDGVGLEPPTLQLWDHQADFSDREGDTTSWSGI